MKTTNNHLLLTVLFVFFTVSERLQSANNASGIALVDKQIQFPTVIYDGANGSWINQTVADYDNAASRFSTKRMKQSTNFVVFWEAGFGENPETAATGYKVPLTTVLASLETMYSFYRDSLKFVIQGSSFTDQYKTVVYLFYNSTFGTVYGSGAGKVGVLLLYPLRIQNSPYGALAHELGHAFQYMVNADGKWGYNGQGTAWEMTSQYMLWQFYANWPTFESYHINDFMKQTHLAFQDPNNQYHAPFVLEYWSSKYGKAFIGNLWRAALSGDDFVMTYKRMKGLTQAAFSDEMFDASRRFITWDMDRARTTMSAFTNKTTYKLTALGSGWKSDVSTAPQNYGYNGIKLNVPSANTIVTASFTGLTSGTGYHVVNPSYAGWRYGFVAYKSNGSRVYSDVFSNSSGMATFTVPAQTTYLWFVVMGAPTVHWKHDATNAEQWPYQVVFNNTNVSGYPNVISSLAQTIHSEELEIITSGSNLTIRKLSDNSIIHLFNASGCCVLKEQSGVGSFVRKLSPGMYVVQVQTGKTRVSRKILIQ